MRALCLLPLLLTATAWADEPSDRAAIEHVIVSLQSAPLAGLLTADADAAVLRQLAAGTQGDRPAVNISHQPWGEATFDLHGWRPASWRLECRGIRFVTSGVAIVQVASLYEYEKLLPETTLYVVVLVRIDSSWKIDYARQYSPRR